MSGSVWLAGKWDGNRPWLSRLDDAVLHTLSGRRSMAGLDGWLGGVMVGGMWELGAGTGEAGRAG